MGFLCFDADHPEREAFWTLGSGSFGTPPNIGKGAPDGDPTISCANIGFEGILSTPAIDGNTAFVVASQISGSYQAPGSYSFFLYSIDLTSGVATKMSSAITATVTGGIGPVTFTPRVQIQRPALTIVTRGGNKFLLIAFSSSCDAPNPFYGWLYSYNVTNPSAQNLAPAGLWNDSSANTDPDGSFAQGGIWMSGMGPAVDNSGNVYLATGNGDYYNPGTVYSDSIVKLTVNATTGALAPVDYFTPYNQHDLQFSDLDLGVSGVSWIQSANMLLSGSKEGKLYLLNANNLGGYKQGQGGTDGVLCKMQGSCDQFGPKSGQSGECRLADAAPAYPALNQPANCQGNIIVPAGDAGYNADANIVYPVDGAVNAQNWPINCFYDQQSWPHLHGAPLYWEGGGQWTYYAGQYDFVRAVQIDTTLKKFTNNFAVASGIAPTIGYGGLMSV